MPQAAAGRLQKAPDAAYFADMPDRNGQTGTQRRSMIALGVVVLLFVVGWVLAHELYSNGKIEDCMLSGRTNCVPLDTQSR